MPSSQLIVFIIPTSQNSVNNTANQVSNGTSFPSNGLETSRIITPDPIAVLAAMICATSCGAAFSSR